MKISELAVAAVVALCCAQTCAGANILAVFPHDGKSHWIVFRELLAELSRKGHRVTVLTRFVEEGHPGWDVIPLKARMGSDDDFDFMQFGALSSREEFMILFHVGTIFCHKLMDDEGVQKLINMREDKFDLLIIEAFFHDCLMALAHKFRTPVVAASALGGGASWVNDMVGNPYPLSYFPEKTFPYTSRMDFLERANNAFSSLALRLHRQYVYLPALDEIVRKHFRDPSMPPLADLERNTSLLLLNSHFSFDYPRPLVPNAVEVAGMHIKPPKKLPQDLQTFMDSATNGVIFFSMGSGIKSANLPKGMQSAFLSVFSKLKQKVLWKYEEDSLPNQPANVRIGKWFPQSDILAHKNLKLFITHGGVMSMQEALYSGVPLLGFPIFGDQESNLLRAQSAGYAIMLALNNITEESIGWAVNELLTNPSYMQNARKYSQLFHDRPEKPLDRAVYWVEYVLRHRGARHLRSAALDLAWHQYLLLDVIAFVVLCALSVLVIVVIAVKLLIRTFFRKSDKVTKKKKNTKNE
ncbi:UDP-glucosyltransferase 2-like [Schistocerca cancellata]|uniref:UDP-glucosyltransferase 2-like n=1 Tax=Schistocerca cancellata TaxID=274614 RepID=UPI0021183712|nr:UDP-glucosyltransferase 2-like [Schistocerca cancellata]